MPKSRCSLRTWVPARSSPTFPPATSPASLGYEDLNDHAFLRRDPLLAAPCTLNRLEFSNNKSTRCHKPAHDPVAIADCLLTMGVRCLPRHAREIVLDLDAMGHLIHGTQEGRHFGGYYDGAAGTVPALEKIVAAIRNRSPHARILVRGDAGFCGRKSWPGASASGTSITVWAWRKTP